MIASIRHLSNLHKSYGKKVLLIEFVHMHATFFATSFPGSLIFPGIDPGKEVAFFAYGGHFEFLPRAREIA